MEHYLQIEACKSFKDEGQAWLVSCCPRILDGGVIVDKEVDT
jgi:hypothetical protein